jgi:hypothetical protein
MSDDSYMRRGKAQVLFNYLPDNTFDYAGKSGIQRVKSIDGVSRSDLDTEYIGQQVLNKVRLWKNDDFGAVGFPSYADSFNLVEPREVKTSLFPLLFRCTTCETIHTYDDTNELAKYNRSLNCKASGCSGRIQQHQFVFIHKCGAIKSPSPGRCSNCGSYDDWTFESYGSERIRNAEWKCHNCDNAEDIDGWCDCDLPSSNMRFTVHRASSAYQLHHITVINIAADGPANAADPRFAKRVLAKYFELTDTPLNEIDLDSRRVSSDREEKQWQLNQYREMYEKSESEQIKSEIDRLEAELEEMDAGDDPIGDVVAELVPFVGTSGELPEDRHQAIHDVFQYLSADRELGRRPARDVILESGPDTPKSRERRELRADRLDQQLSDLGLRDAAFIEDFPITNVVFGYTRDNREPENSRLVGFQESQVDVSGDGTPLFVDTVETEAVQFSLKPRRVMQWLLSNSRLDSPSTNALQATILDSTLPSDRRLPVRDTWDAGTVAQWVAASTATASDTELLGDWSDADIRAWLVANIGKIPDFEQLQLEAAAIDPDNGVDAITYFVYHLVHTYAHLVLKHATQLSGMSRTSLAEFLLPRTLSFIIYSNQRTDFNIGGLYTLVEASLRDLLSEVETRGNDCVYDPVCSRDGSACHSCLFLSEVSCVHLNRNLGRDFVYGSKTTADRNLNGYLNSTN